MYTEEFQRWVKMGQQFNSPLTDLNKTLTTMCQHINQHQLNLLAENFSLIADQLKRISEVHKPEEYLSLQKEIVNEDINAMINNMYSLVHESLSQLEKLGSIITDFNNQASTMNKNMANMAMKDKYSDKEKRKEKNNQA